MRLATEPSVSVTVTITSADANAVPVDHTDGDNGNGAQNTLAFSASSWDTRQTAMPAAAQDNAGVHESVVATNAGKTFMPTAA